MTEAANPVHMVSGPGARWTTVNFGEAIGGVQTPMSWSVWDYGMEKATRRAFGAMGLFTHDEVIAFLGQHHHRFPNKFKRAARFIWPAHCAPPIL